MQARSGFDSNFTSYDYMAIVGQSLGLIYGYEFDGIYQYSDFYSVPGSSTLILKEGVTSNPSLGNRLSPGAVKYKDQDGDGWRIRTPHPDQFLDWSAAMRRART
jgi:hypothetical protein